VKLLYATIPRPEEVDEYYYDEDAELSMVLYNGLFEIDMAFYPSVVASFNMSQKDIMYTTHVGLSAIIIKVALTDELFLKVCYGTSIRFDDDRSSYVLLFLCTTELHGHQKRIERDHVVRSVFEDIFRVRSVR